ncbi:hypothetical protein I7I48_10414 [Histoplasma ohiense]|nr:hypothetical protein I7I48_10414 [Histoplasma ohiense (nom. inval.)]
MTTASKDAEVEDEHVEGRQGVRRAGVQPRGGRHRNSTQRRINQQRHVGEFVDFSMYRDRIVEANWVGIVQWPSSRQGPGVAVGGSRLPPYLMNVNIDDNKSFFSTYYACWDYPSLL